MSTAQLVCGVGACVCVCVWACWYVRHTHNCTEECNADQQEGSSNGYHHAYMMPSGPHKIIDLSALQLAA
ncbi:hypothetical protein P167DRAFT_270311 [Morchella conica CCBAS932]|uniref:Secreted protein n=1 Tax=Morchella conica CCBAS932 TaxID=1392247 RepID=A0A3N4KLK2_9PEZI|nr:hypothetical protein P167DRAFT_270311 [Morchella conica CCBAS932]